LFEVTAKRYGIPYDEVPAPASYREVARYLGDVSEAARS